MQTITHNPCGRVIFSYDGDVHDGMIAERAIFPDQSKPEPGERIILICECGVPITGWSDMTVNGQ